MSGQDMGNGHGRAGGGPPAGQQRIEAIKQYYNQLCTNLRHIVNQLNAPDITAQRKIALLAQQDQVQKSLQDFTEKVLRPLANAASTAGGLPPGGMGMPAVPMAPPAAPVHSAPASGTVLGTRPAHTPPAPPPHAPKPPGISPTLPPPGSAQIPPQPQAPAMLFQNAPPAARQTLLAMQKQAQMIQQQQTLFNQRLQSKNFDLSLHHAHQDHGKPRFDDHGAGAANFFFVSEMASIAGKAGADSHAQAAEKTINDLLGEISPGWTCSTEIEEALLRVADDFLDNVGCFAAQLALNRKDTRLTKKDVELAIERTSSIILPGSYRSTVLAGSIRKLSKKPAAASNNQHNSRMAQLKKHLASQQ